MAALPYMQFSVRDYIGSTMHLSTEEHGAYMLILMRYWYSSAPVPIDRLPVIAKMSAEQWGKAWSESLESLFVVTDLGVIPSDPPYRTPGTAREYSPLFAKNRLKLLESHDGKCFYCEQQSDDFEVDHILPVARGGGRFSRKPSGCLPRLQSVQGREAAF